MTAGSTTTVDYGYYREGAAIGNFVWADENNNGVQDEFEPGIDGVKVTLTIINPNGVNTTVTVVSGDDPSTAGVIELGWYSFGNLMLDENYKSSSTTGTPTSDQPVYKISIDTNQSALATLAVAPRARGLRPLILTIRQESSLRPLRVRRIRFSRAILQTRGYRRKMTSGSTAYPTGVICRMTVIPSRRPTMVVATVLCRDSRWVKTLVRSSMESQIQPPPATTSMTV